MPPSCSPGSSGGYGDGGGVVGARLMGSGAARSQSPPAIRQPTDSEPATEGCARGARSKPVCLMGWWGNNAKNRVSRTRSRCSLKRVAPFAVQGLQFLASFSANFPIPSHFLHPPPPNFLTLSTSSSSPTLPPELQDQSPHPTPIAVLLPSLSVATATPIITSQPLRGFSSAASFRNSSELEIWFPPLPITKYAAMYVQKRGKSALPIASPPPVSNPTQMDARSAYSSTRSQLAFRDCAMGSIWTTLILWPSPKR